MNWLRPRRPSPALVISIIALVVALGGTGYAAVTLPKNSVGTRQLKKNAVISSKVKNGSLKTVDFAPGQLPAGPRGPKGDKGDPGTNGTNGTNAATNVIVRTTASGTNSAIAQCLPGERATGGGAGAGADSLRESKPWVVGATSHVAGDGDTPNAWEVTKAAGTNITAFVVCASP